VAAVALAAALVLAGATACTRETGSAAASGRHGATSTTAAPVGIPIARTLGTASSAAPRPSVRSVDWGNVTVLSACGLADVLVRSGSGGRYVDGRAYGIDIVDVAVADLTGDGVEDAAVLVDCLGGPEPYPHVLVIPSDGVTRLPPGVPGALGVVAVAPSSGGSVGYGERPMWIGAAPGRAGRAGIVSVRTDAGSRELQYAPGVLVGGELEASGPATYQGTVVAAQDGIVTLALTPDDGYRIPYDRTMPVLDARTGAWVTVDDLVGQDLSVFVDADGRVSSAQHLRRGPS
jgi:hypothetical protein